VGRWVWGRADLSPAETDRNELRFCYYKEDNFVNRPLTIAPAAEVAERTGEVVETMASLARTFTADEITALVEELGEAKVLEFSVLIEELGKSRLKDILDETAN